MNLFVDFHEDLAGEISANGRWLSLPRRPTPRKTVPSDLASLSPGKCGLWRFSLRETEPAHFAASLFSRALPPAQGTPASPPLFAPRPLGPGAALPAGAAGR